MFQQHNALNSKVSDLGNVFLQFRHRSQRAMLRHSRNFAGRRVLLLFCASYEPMTQSNDDENNRKASFSNSSAL